MIKKCPNSSCAFPYSFIRDGSFRRKEDSKTIQRFRCKTCGTRFSTATFAPTFRQKKRRINGAVLKALSSNMSLRRAAIFLDVDRKTIARKLIFLGGRCRKKNDVALEKLRGRIHHIQLDDLITKEHSKLKPLAVTVVVDEYRRRILALEVSQIPAFGHLADLARKKYGKREDKHFDGLNNVFKKISPIVSQEVLIKTDEHSRYPFYIRKYLPHSKHMSFKSERGCIAGQGELKKVKFDPLFTVNHTCAALRANINRLIRKTWCTTKNPKRLQDHLDIFMYYYNEVLLRRNLAPL